MLQLLLLHLPEHSVSLLTPCSGMYAEQSAQGQLLWLDLIGRRIELGIGSSLKILSVKIANQHENNWFCRF
jgi:hypothetical protein